MPSTPKPIGASAQVVVERFIDDVLNGGRPAAAPMLVASEPLRTRIRVLRQAFADLRVTTVRAVADGPLVAVHFVATGTHTGSFAGSAATGRRWSSSGTGIYEVDDGRIVDFWVTWDTLDILEQLGVVRRAAGASA